MIIADVVRNTISVRWVGRVKGVSGSEVEMDLRSVVKFTVILKDIGDFKDMHKIWKKYFGEGEYPARTVITSEFVKDDILVQIEGTACYDR